ncbi:MAG: cobyrinate a,c-diamide synthase [Bacillota bacterium]|jgi:cobyrinic acid a,c-diamide synthase
MLDERSKRKRHSPRLLIAAPSSGQGKTTVTLGLLRALSRHGLTVQPFKIGPDYIDPGHHTRAAGRASRNLDGWLIGSAASQELFQRAAAGADISIVEGVMGLFDGLGDGSSRASSAEMARLLALPVILVVDVAAQGASAAATVLGFQSFDPAVRIAGVILNRVGSERHASLVEQAIAKHCGVPVLGALPRNEELVIPERHLGLHTVAEQPWEPVYDRLAGSVEQNVRLDLLRLLAAEAPPLPEAEFRLFTALPDRTVCRVGVALDEAFNFLYADNLDLMRLSGAELVFFSLLRDGAVPPGCTLLYIGGGYPELHARTLAANRAMLDSVREFARSGGRIYGECGGLMFLGEGLTDPDGNDHQMAGLLPVRTTMAGRRLTLGYVEARSETDSVILGRGEQVRAHMFHYSEAETLPGGKTCLTVRQAVGTTVRRDGWQAGSVFGSYLHLHFASAPQVLRRLLGGRV